MRIDKSKAEREAAEDEAAEKEIERAHRQLAAHEAEPHDFWRLVEAKQHEIERLREAYLFLGRAVIDSPSRAIGVCGQQTGMGMRRIQLDLSGLEYGAVVDETHRLGHIAREGEQNGNQ